MKIVVPLAGLGTRLKPHTNSIPKPLMDVAGKPIIEYVISDCMKLDFSEIIFVVGYKKKSIKEYIKKYHPNLVCSFVEQKKRDGDGSAVRLALENLFEDEDLYVVFGADTLIDFDVNLSIKKEKNSEAIIFVKEVKDPTHYGIVNVKENLEIYEIEEKPKNPKSNLAIIGAYYFRSAFEVKMLLDDFYAKKETINGEYKIAQVIDSFVKMKDRRIKAVKVKEWFDCGRPEVLLGANRYFLSKNSSNIKKVIGDSLIIPPSFVSKDAKIVNCIIGPYASIGSEVEIENCIVKDSVVSYKSSIKNAVLEESLIGKQVNINGKKLRLNLGEKSNLDLF